MVDVDRATGSSIIALKEIGSMKAVAQSPEIFDLKFTPHSHGHTVTGRCYLFSLQNEILCTNIMLDPTGAGPKKYLSVFVISSIETKQVLFKYTIGGIHFFTPEIHPNGIVLPTDEDKYKIFRLSQQIIDAALRPSSASTIAESPRENLKDAYLSCIEHRPSFSAARCCTELITFDRCKASFSEYFYAHRLLMLAVAEGSIPATTDFNGEPSKCFKSIYKAGKEFPVYNEAESDALERILHEARSVGVIKDGTVVLSALYITQEVQAKHTAIFNIGCEIFERLVCLEEGHQSLKDAFERYKHMQGMTELLGIALNVIPLCVAPLVAGISTGAQIFEGLALGEVAKFGSEETDVLMANSDTLEKLLLRYAGRQLSREYIDGMNNDQRKDLLQNIENSGTSPEILHCIFMRAVNGQYVNPTQLACSSYGVEMIDRPEIVAEASTDNSKGVDVKANDDEEADKVGNDANDDGMEQQNTVESDIETVEKFQISNVCAPQSVASASNAVSSPETFTTSLDLAQLHNFELSKRSVKNLKANDLACLMAAFFCDYDLSDLEAFKSLASAFTDCLQKKKITSRVIWNRKTFPSELVSAKVMQFMSENYPKILDEDEFFGGKLYDFFQDFSE